MFLFELNQYISINWPAFKTYVQFKLYFFLNHAQNRHLNERTSLKMLLHNISLFVYICIHAI